MIEKNKTKRLIYRIASHPLSSAVLAALIVDSLPKGMFRSAWSWLMGLPMGTWLSTLLLRVDTFLSQPIPLWSLLLMIVCWILLRKAHQRWGAALLRPTTTTTSTNSTKVSTVHGSQASYEENERPIVHDDGIVSTKVLEQNRGTISVWALVIDDHNRMRPTTRYCYIMAHSGNNGEALGNPAMATYPNAWAIGRILPIRDRPEGQWRFFCNAVEKPQTLIATKRLLSPGWRLFTLEWSKTDNFIRFHIDDDVVEEKPFGNWPQHVSGDFTLGKWSSNVQGHGFNSEVGPVIVSKECLKAGELATRIANRPSIKA